MSLESMTALARAVMALVPGSKMVHAEYGSAVGVTYRVGEFYTTIWLRRFEHYVRNDAFPVVLECVNDADHVARRLLMNVEPEDEA